jgi:hypothetical protein
MKPYPSIFRQGDVCLVQVDELPADCDLVPGQAQKIVLAWGEVTGHHHRIEDHVLAETVCPPEVHKTATAASAPAKARSWHDKIVLAWGQVMGHHPRIEDHVLAETVHPSDVRETATVVAAGAQAKARLWRDKRGDRFLEVESPVTLRHEEHTAHTVPPGVYKLPNQVEYTPVAVRRVVD